MRRRPRNAIALMGRLPEKPSLRAAVGQVDGEARAQLLERAVRGLANVERLLGDMRAAGIDVDADEELNEARRYYKAVIAAGVDG